MHRRSTTAMVAGASLVGLIGAACSGDDDAADETTVAVATAEPVAGSTSPPTQPPTTPAPTTRAQTTPPAPPTTVVDVEALKAQIKADWERSWGLRTQLTESPTLDNLDTTLAQIAAPGSDNYNTLKQAITDMVERSQHVVRGNPDYFNVTVEKVDLVGGPPYTEAVVTICYVSNRVMIDASGQAVSDTEGLVAARRQDHVVVTANGWLPDAGFVDTWQGLDVTGCPPE